MNAMLPTVEGYEWRELQIVRFHDHDEGKPWWARDVETVGHVAALCDGPVPADASEVLRVVAAEFGAGVSVIW